MSMSQSGIDSQLSSGRGCDAQHECNVDYEFAMHCGSFYTCLHTAGRGHVFFRRVLAKSRRRRWKGKIVQVQAPFAKRRTQTMPSRSCPTSTAPRTTRARDGLKQAQGRRAVSSLSSVESSRRRADVERTVFWCVSVVRVDAARKINLLSMLQLLRIIILLSIAPLEITGPNCSNSCRVCLSVSCIDTPKHCALNINASPTTHHTRQAGHRAATQMGSETIITLVCSQNARF